MEDIAEDIEEHVEDYAVTLFLSEQGYFKKITPQSLRMNSTQSFKDGDRLCQSFESSNAQELIFFTNMHCAYKTRVNEFDDTKASSPWRVCAREAVHGTGRGGCGDGGDIRLQRVYGVFL